MLKIIKNIFLLSLFFLLVNCDQSSQSKNNSNSMVTVKVFSSLTCPHCADFHGKIYEELEKEYISVGKVKVEHHSFPLDLAALNAEKILQCSASSQVNFKFLTELYKKQNKWASGSDISNSCCLALWLLVLLGVFWPTLRRSKSLQTYQSN